LGAKYYNFLLNKNDEDSNKLIEKLYKYYAIKIM